MKRETFNLETRAAETYGSSRKKVKEKPFKYQELGESFRVSSDIIKHQRIHTEEKL